MNLMDDDEQGYSENQAVHELLDELNAAERVGHTDWRLAPYRADLARILEQMVREADYPRIRRFLNFMEREEQR